MWQAASTANLPCFRLNSWNPGQDFLSNRQRQLDQLGFVDYCEKSAQTYSKNVNRKLSTIDEANWSNRLCKSLSDRNFYILVTIGNETDECFGSFLPGQSGGWRGRGRMRWGGRRRQSPTRRRPRREPTAAADTCCSPPTGPSRSPALNEEWREVRIMIWWLPNVLFWEEKDTFVATCMQFCPSLIWPKVFPEFLSPRKGWPKAGFESLLVFVELIYATEKRLKIQSVPSARGPGLGWLSFWVFHCLPNSAGANGNLAEAAGQMAKMV